MTMHRHGDPHGDAIAFFDERAEEWDAICPAPPMERLRAVAALARLIPNAVVLDVGSGTGALLPALLERLDERGRIVALDPAQAMLDRLIAKFPDPRVSVRCETLEECRLPAAGLDAVICFSCFPHITDPAAGIANAARLLRSGGRLVIAHVSSRDEINDFHRKAGTAVEHHTLPDAETMHRFLRDAGLTPAAFVDEAGRYELVALRS